MGLLFKKEGKSFSFLSLDVLWCFLYLLFSVCSLRLVILMDKYRPSPIPGRSPVEHTCWVPVPSEEWAVENLSWGGRKLESGPQAS